MTLALLCAALAAAPAEYPVAPAPPTAPPAPTMPVSAAPAPPVAPPQPTPPTAADAEKLAAAFADKLKADSLADAFDFVRANGVPLLLPQTDSMRESLQALRNRYAA